MEDLREVTFQYTNVSDPTELAARRQRLTHSEEEGLMEQTADRIIAHAINNLRNPSEDHQLSINTQLDP